MMRASKKKTWRCVMGHFIRVFCFVIASKSMCQENPLESNERKIEKNKTKKIWRRLFLGNNDRIKKNCQWVWRIKIHSWWLSNGPSSSSPNDHCNNNNNNNYGLSSVNDPPIDHFLLKITYSGKKEENETNEISISDQRSTKEDKLDRW